MSALGLLAVGAAALPAATAAEEASQPPSPAAAQLDAGRNHTCALRAGAGIRCWGFGGEGALGYSDVQTIGDDETPGVAGPVDLGAGLTAASISAGDFHTCARLEGGSVRCWGFGQNGRLGHERETNVGDDEAPGSIAPLNLGAGRTAVAISAGGSHSCALLDDDTLRCWGYGYYGALGHGGGDPNASAPASHPQDIGDNEVPGSIGAVSFGPGRRAVAISAGGYHTCALLDDGTVRCWGYAAQGQLGYGNALNVADATTAGPVDLGGQTAVAIGAGESHTCALLADGGVRCWGSGAGGRLGYGNQRAIGDDELPGSIPPVNLGPGRTAVAISAGGSHTCALLDGGDVRCWGLAIAGQLGYGNTSNIGDNETPDLAGPVNLGPGRTALAISAGAQHTCTRRDDFTVACWGYGGNGRLGYCNERNIGDDELPGTLGPVPADVAFTAPDVGYPGCARLARGAVPPPAPDGAAEVAQSRDVAIALEREALRRRSLRSCLARAARHGRRELRRARRRPAQGRMRVKRRVKRQRSRKRRACLKRYGRTPGGVTGLTARPASSRSIVLTFNAAGTDRNLPPAARTYLVKQARRPIGNRRDFRRAHALCEGRCRFAAVREVGGELTLTVKDLRPRTTYYYAVAARDNVSGRLGPRSRTVKVRTR